MDLEKKLLERHSKEFTESIVNYIGNDSKKFEKLLSIMFTGKGIVSQRAAWAFSYCAINHLKALTRHFNGLIKLLEDSSHHPAIHRNILRVFQEINVPDKYCARLIEICFKNIMSQMQPIAVRAFAITVAANICERFPELKNELFLILNEINQLPQNPAIKHRTRVALKQLEN